MIIPFVNISRDCYFADAFERIRKTKVDGIHAISCSKNLELPPEYAIGYTTGVIRTIDLALASKNTYKHEFKAGN